MKMNKTILGCIIVACALFLSTQALALDPWIYIRTPCSEGDVYERMGFPDRRTSYIVGNSERQSLYYQRTNHNGKQVIIIFTVVSTNRGTKVISKTVNIMRGNPPVW